MWSLRKKTGNRGEDIATDFLKQKGYKIIDRNVVIKGVGEIDIVAKKNGKIVIVEVRTKSGEKFGSPEESITDKKRNKLVSLAHLYLQQKKLLDVDFGVDGVFVEIKNDGYEVRHLQDMLV